MPCPDLEHIERFAEGVLSAEISAAMERHLGECETCRSQAEQVRANLDMAQRVANAGIEPHAIKNDKTPRNIPDHTDAATRPLPANWKSPSAPLPADAFPGYTLTKEISRGGQGIIYRATQQSTRRQVAIKVLRAGTFADPRERARFEREVHILGQLKHPNIVTIHDGGTVGEHPFYVMDYISGTPLDVYVRALAKKAGSASGLLGEVILLFAKVCDAVHAAHLKGVIHRDLKPSNIRVDTHGEPHVLDFGIAKLSGVPDFTTPAVTMTGEFIGSLPWSSPEQAEGQPEKIDIRTDVYALGVILYQLLTDRFPYNVRGNVREVLNRIINREPVRPSKAAEEDTTLANPQESPQPVVVKWNIDDDLETIVLRCLAKDRDRRYQSAADLARDLRHYLSGEPIEARRDSAIYLFRKTLHRYRMGVRVAVAYVLLTIVSLIALAISYERERTARTDAQENERIAKEQSEEARKQTERAETSAREASMAKNMAQDRYREAQRLSNQLGLVLQAKGDFAEVVPQFRRDLETALQMSERPNPEVATYKLHLAAVLYIIGEYEEAEQLLDSSIEIRERIYGKKHPLVVQCRHILADLLLDVGRCEEAATEYRDVLEHTPRQDIEGVGIRINALVGLAEALCGLMRFDESRDQLLAAQRILNRPNPQFQNRFRQPIFQGFVDLYDAWHIAEPAAGYDRKSDDYRRRLDQSRQASTQPTTRPARPSFTPPFGPRRGPPGDPPRQPPR